MTTAIRHFSRADLAELTNYIVGERLAGRPEQDVRTVSAVQNYVLGCSRLFDRGRKLFRYGSADAGAACVLGFLHRSALPVVTEINLAPLANYAIGTRVIGLTTGAAVALNEYAGGWLYVDTGAGQGECLRILSHPANAGAAACLFTCLDALTIAFDGTTTCSLVANPYANVIICDSPATSLLVGVPLVTIAAGSFGWFQRRGPAVIVADTAPPVVGSRTNAGLNVDGTIGVDVAGTVLGLVGDVIRTDIATSSALINLKLE